MTLSCCKKLSALLKEVPSNHGGDFHCLNCFHSFRTKIKLKKHEDVCKNHDYCYAEMPKEDNEILKYNHGQKSMKVPFIIYADMESLLKQIVTCHNDPKNSSTSQINLHTACGYSLFADCLFDATKNKISYYRGKDCMKEIVKT